MIILIPLFYYAKEDIDIVRERQIAEGASAVKNAVGYLIEIGIKSATREIITNPSGITGYNITGTMLNIYFKEQNITTYFQLPIFQGSKWPITQGIHRINIYYDGKYIFFAECGNDIIEAYEQCDGTQNPCPSGTCNPPGSVNECMCTCGSIPPCSGNCQQGYSCDANSCACQPTGLCSPGYTWINGACCIDNDGDGAWADLGNGACSPIDCDDNRNCIHPITPVYSTTNEATNCPAGTIPCNNGRDEDCDGTIDCADSDCVAAPNCIPCGDGTLDPSIEECDDGNLVSGDGCDSNCLIELDWFMDPNPTTPSTSMRHNLTQQTENLFRTYSSATGNSDITVHICDAAGCDINTDMCLGLEICSFTFNANTPIPPIPPSCTALSLIHI